MSAQQKEALTATELGKLWATYVGNTMSQCVLTYYLHHIEDQEIKKVVEHALKLSNTFVEEIKKIYNQEDVPIPVGFSKDDVNLDAPRLFADEFYLRYLRYASKAGFSLYSIAIPLVLREDVKKFFENCISSTVKLIEEINTVALKKNVIQKPPVIPIPGKVDFVKRQSFLGSLLKEERPLHALEITHLYDNIDNDVASKVLLIGFSQVAEEEKIQDYFKRGRDITDKHIELCSTKLKESGLPALQLLDHFVTDSTIAPFSDKLMLFHKIDMFSMKIRSYANAISLNGRRDLGTMYGKFIVDVGLFVEDGANIFIDHGWMEQPPISLNRDEL